MFILEFFGNNLALSKLIVSITGKDSISLEDFEKFPSIWIPTV